MNPDALAVFALAHGRVHSARVSTVPSVAARVFGDLTDAQWRRRPGPGLNSLLWLLWHMARVEDVGVNLVVVPGRQVLDDGWTGRIGVPRTDVGTGMTEAEVADLSERADVEAVRAYRDAVGLRTRDVVAGLTPARYAELVDAAEAARLPPSFQPLVGQSRGLELMTSAVLHSAMHLGEAVTLRELAGLDVR